MRKGKDKGCCKSNKVVLSLASLIMLIALALGVNATVTMDTVTPWQDGTIIRVNFSQESDVDGVLINVSSISTANSSNSLVYNATNGTDTFMSSAAVKTGFNFTFGNNAGNATLEDATNYVATAVVYFNDTQQVSSSVTITIDRYAPTEPTLPSPSGRQTSRTQTIQATVNGANTTGCTLRFIGSHPGQVYYAMTHTGNNCSQSFSNMPGATFRYRILASDSTNESAESPETSFYVDIAAQSGARKYIAATGGGGSKALPPQASSTAQQRAFGKQAENTLDRVIAKAPANAQQGLTKAKESVTKQYKGFEAVKTWSGTAIGCGAGMMGLVLGPLGLVTIPAGCISGHLLGAIV